MPHRRLLMPPSHPREPGTRIPCARPGMVLFDVPSARELSARCAMLDPGARLSRRRSWVSDPGAGDDGLLARLTACAGIGRGTQGRTETGLWYWARDEEDLLAQANAILLRFVHPLVARGLPYCVGFPFGPGVFEPRPLTLAGRCLLDLEDIGVLLREGQGSPLRGSPHPLPGHASDESSARLDAAQRAAVEHACGAARVLAPAGSGKTKTLVSRVFELVARGVDPARILLLAFNTKAAAQLEERLEGRGIATTRRIDPEASSRAVHCATFNAFGARYQREIMRVRPEVDTHGAGRRAMMRQAMEEAGFGLTALKPARGADPVGALLAALGRVRAALEDPEGIVVPVSSTADPPVAGVPFGPVHAAYSRLQVQSGRQSFDDQVYLAVVDMLAAPRHRRCIQQRYAHILVDEFQDLNGAQLALVDLLSRPHRDLFVVGDDDQLIYGWRFADPNGILRFHERLPPRPWSATYTLATNYRCSRAVVESAARLVGNNAVREAKEVRPRAGAQEGALHFVAAPTWAERGAALCAFLRAEQTRLGCEWRDLAVLCRYRSQQLAVALALDAAGVPRPPQLGCRLFSHPAARQVRTCIEAVRAPAAPRVDLQHRALTGLSRRQRAALAERVETLHAEFRAGLGDTPSGPAARSALGPRTAAHLLAGVVDAFGLEERWRQARSDLKDGLGGLGGAAHDASGGAADDAGGGAAGDTPGDEAGPFQVLDALVLLAEAFPAPDGFLAAWDRLQAAEEADSGGADRAAGSEEGTADCVALGTIHAAKGREYHAVAIPDYDCDVTRWSAAAIEEERRVVYVGVTRARDTVLLTVDASRGYVHPFLRELVEAPRPDEHAALVVRLRHEQDLDTQTRLQRRVSEIEVLFPELVPPAPARPTSRVP